MKLPVKTIGDGPGWTKDMFTQNQFLIAQFQLSSGHSKYVKENKRSFS